MKLTKFAVLAMGVLGIASFFLPLIHVKVDNFEGKASAFEVVRGLEQAKKMTKDLRDKATKGMADKVEGVVHNARVKAELDALQQRENTATYVVLMPFIPPVLFLLFAILGMVKGSFGRGFGAGTLLFALLGLGLWALMYSAATDQHVEDSLGIGAYALGVSYAGATVMGLLSLFNPDTGDNW